ncbi:hypothetical protein GQ53DRAFT_827402 [Thozetella sp. PMI_491]|nr:hypothetical protein GQ53DRAFT_827402 [Thozetella sp. PMI_491]
MVPTQRFPRITFTYNPAPPGHLAPIHEASHDIGRFYAGVLGAGEVDHFYVRDREPRCNVRQFYHTVLYMSTLASASQWALVQDLSRQLLDHVEPLLQEGDHCLDLIVLDSQKAYGIVRKELGPEHPQTLSTTRALHSAYYAQRNWIAGLSAIRSATKIEAKLNMNNPMRLDAQLRIAKSIVALDDFQGMVDILDLLDLQESVISRMAGGQSYGAASSIQRQKFSWKVSSRTLGCPII